MLGYIVYTFATLLEFILIFIFAYIGGKDNNSIHNDDYKTFIIVYIIYSAFNCIKFIIALITTLMVVYWGQPRPKFVRNLNTALVALSFAYYIPVMITYGSNTTLYIVGAIIFGLFNIIELILAPYNRADDDL